MRSVSSLSVNSATRTVHESSIFPRHLAAVLHWSEHSRCMREEIQQDFKINDWFSTKPTGMKRGNSVATHQELT